MRKLITLSSITGLVFAAAAAAASAANISISLHPDKVKKNSTLSISATGFPTETSLPTSAEFQVQPGFKTSLKSVSKLCNPSASSCPAQSKIGKGTAQLTASNLGLSIPDTVNFTIYLGTAKQAGDIASVVLTGSDTYLQQTLTGSGRLFRTSGGGLELLFDHLPSVSGLPSGISITLNSLSVSAGATRSVKHHRKRITHSLITNPSSCSGSWTGSGSVTFGSGQTVSQNISTACAT
jgi:hypothetical protein